MGAVKLIALFLLLSLDFSVPAQKLYRSTFDVAVVRPSKAGDESSGYNPNPNNFSAKGSDLLFLVQIAYGMNAHDIVGIPPSLSRQRFDVQAKVEDDASSAKLRYSSDEGKRIFETRLQGLLSERFHLKLHHAEATRRVLYLEADKHVSLLPALRQTPMQTTGSGRLKFDVLSLSGLASVLSSQLSINVLDRTGISGEYSFDLSWPTSNVPSGDAPLDQTSALNDVLGSQCGLKLVPGKASVPILVIDSATFPSPN